MQIAQVVGITGHSLTLRSKGRCAIKPRSAPELRRYARNCMAPCKLTNPFLVRFHKAVRAAD